MNSTRWFQCFLLLATILGTSGAGGREPSRRPPNLVLIMADDLGFETLGANGGTSYSTPNLDKLAQGGMRFTYAYSTPLCTPTRVQLMTGKYNFRNYIGFGLLDPAERTFAHLLQKAGYRTAVVGKWQLYGNRRQRTLTGRTGTLPQDAGFDEYCLWQVKRRAGPRYKNPYLDILGESSRVYPGAYGPDVFADAIESFFERNRERPFFLYYPMALTHSPFQPTPRHPDYEGFDPTRDGSDPKYFKDNVAYMDKIVGRIARKLERLGLRENTLLMFVGDNGTHRRIRSQIGERRVQGAKGQTTDAGTHVPMIVNWPGTVAPGQVNRNLIDFTDFLPTRMEAAQVELPKDFIFDGISFYPQLLGNPGKVREWVFCHYDPRLGRRPLRRYVHDRDWKLYADGTFFHISEDPEEKRSVLDKELAQETLQLKRNFQAVLGRMR